MRLATSSRLAIPRTVWMLGFVSLCMDFSSELVHSLLPIFLVSSMGMSMSALGLVEGVAEAIALIVKVFSGAISDYLGRRKGLILFGYGLGALTKPLFPLAAVPEVVVAARWLDRFGKGVRGAPRDALVADVAPPAIRGACFGLRQSMDTIGAFLGPLAAIALMYGFANDIRAVLWFAVIPALLCVTLILFGVEETRPPSAGHVFRSPLHWSALREFPARYWLVVGIGAIFTLARFSEAFLVMRAQQSGLPLMWIPGVMVVMSVAYALSAYPAGVLSDRLGRRWLLSAGLALQIAADLILGLGASVGAVMAGVAIWGLHMGLTQGILAAMVAEVSPPALRGTAFGVFNLASGVCMLAASVLAGWLWDRYGAPATFLTGAALCVVPLLLSGAVPHRAAR